MDTTSQIEKRKKLQWLSMVEPLGVFVLILLYIWRLRYTFHSSWMGILILILLSHLYHREKPAGLGLRPKNFMECLREMSPPLVFVSLALLSLGILLETTRRITIEQGLLSFAAYCPWGLFQQYLLNSYFVNRFQAVWPARMASALSAALFSGAHFPNWFLMLVTCVAGYCCARIYLKHRNLYFLGLAHATIGFLLYFVVPDSISHHLNVGPSWYAR